METLSGKPMKSNVRSKEAVTKNERNLINLVNGVKKLS